MQSRAAFRRGMRRTAFRGQSTQFLGRKLTATLSLCLLAALSLPPSIGQQKRTPDVHYAPTPGRVVERMLRLAKVGPRDVVYDLGSGDGRVVIAAAKQFGARGVGIELDAKLIEKSRQKAQEAGVSDRVTFRHEDLFEANVRDATVVITYLLQPMNERLRPILWRQLRRGSRVLTHSFDMGPKWPADERVDMVGSTIYMWTVK